MIRHTFINLIMGFRQQPIYLYAGCRSTVEKIIYLRIKFTSNSGWNCHLFYSKCLTYLIFQIIPNTFQCCYFKSREEINCYHWCPLSLQGSIYPQNRPISKFNINHLKKILKSSIVSRNKNACLVLVNFIYYLVKSNLITIYMFDQ